MTSAGTRLIQRMIGRHRATGHALIACIAGALVLPSAAQATFPGKNGKIAFATGGGAIATMRPDGSRVRYLGRGSDPAWSADGRLIAFARNNGGQSDLYTMRADGSGVRRLTATPQWYESQPSFSRGGGRILFTRRYPGGPKVVIMDLDRGYTRILTSTYGSTEWAPDGRHIVFVGPSGGLVTVRPDGTHARRITTPGDDGPYGDYSSDSRSIFFNRIGASPGYRDYLMRVGAFGANPRYLPTPANFSDPAPAPEGGCVVGSAHGAVLGNAVPVAIGRRCPVSGQISDIHARSPSWQALPGG